MGSTALAQTEPAVMLGPLLRTLIYIGPDDRTRFGVDRPSVLLDRQFGQLLATLGIAAAQEPPTDRSAQCL